MSSPIVDTDSSAPSYGDKFDYGSVSLSTAIHEEATGEEDDVINVEDVAPGGFVKTLNSDLSESESLVLLQRVQANEDLFQIFDASELELLSQVLSVLHFNEGDKIISKGEAATFCGIVLSGAFNVLVNPTLSIVLGVGAMIGEMSIFEGGVRNADVIAGPDAVVAVITFKELDGLQISMPRLQSKMIRLFGAASLRKVRVAAAAQNANNAAAGPPPSAAAASATTSKPATGATGTTATPSTTASSTTSGGPPLKKQISSRRQSNTNERDYLEENKIESLYRGRMARQKQSAKSALENEKQSRLNAEKVKNKQQALLLKLQEKCVHLNKEVERIRNENQALKNQQEAESRHTQRTIIGLQEENARWKIRYNSEVIQRQGTEDQLSDVLQNMQTRHLKAVTMLRVGVPGAQLDPEEEKILARFATPKAKSVLLTDDTPAPSLLSPRGGGGDGASFPSLPATSPTSAAANAEGATGGVRDREAVKRQFRQLTKLAVAQHNFVALTQMKAHARDTTKAQVNMNRAYKELEERLKEAEKKVRTMDALRESAYQASISYELNQKRMLSRLEMANHRLQEQKEELQQLKLLLRTVVCTRYMKDFKTKRNLIALQSKIQDMEMYALERIYAVVPNSFQQFLLSNHENENSSSLGGSQAGAAGSSALVVGKIQPSSPQPQQQQQQSLTSATTATTEGDKEKSGDSQTTVAVVGTMLTPLTSSEGPGAISSLVSTNPTVLTSLARTPAEELSLLHERKKKRLHDLIAHKAKMSHAEFIMGVDEQVEKLHRSLAQALHALSFHSRLSSELSAQLTSQTSENDSMRRALAEISAKWITLQQEREAQQMLTREAQNKEAEAALLRREEMLRITRTLKQLRGEVETVRREKIALEEEIRERSELKQMLVKSGGDPQHLAAAAVISGSSSHHNRTPSSMTRLILHGRTGSDSDYMSHYAAEEAKEEALRRSGAYSSGGEHTRTGPLSPSHLSKNASTAPLGRSELESSMIASSRAQTASAATSRNFHPHQSPLSARRSPAPPSQQQQQHQRGGSHSPNFYSPRRSSHDLSGAEFETIPSHPSAASNSSLPPVYSSSQQQQQQPPEYLLSPVGSNAAAARASTARAYMAVPRGNTPQSHLDPVSRLAQNILAMQQESKLQHQQQQAVQPTLQKRSSLKNGNNNLNAQPEAPVSSRRARSRQAAVESSY